MAVLFWPVLALLVLVTVTVWGQVRRCDVPADVVFLMDASDSIKDTEWEQEKDFVSVLIDNLEVERYAIHVGVIVYSTDIGLVIDLQPFKTKTQLKDLLQTASQINQGTDTAKAIRKLVEMSDNQGRLEIDAKQIAVIITDGRSTDVPATIKEARRARNEYNIDMIALGVGNETFPQELEEIAGPENKNRLFQVSTFAQLRDVVKQLENIICEIVPPTTKESTTVKTTTQSTLPTTTPFIPPFPCSEPADVVFLIDGSYSISAQDWVKGKQFVSYLINSIDIGVNSIHVGLIVYSSAIGDVVSLEPFRGKQDLIMSAKELIQPPVGSTNTALGLQTMREMFTQHARPGVPHIGIVITDGMSSNPSDTRDQAQQAKIEGITLFVVGVGNRVLKEEVEDMASSRETLFDAPDFKILLGMVEQLRDRICSVIGEPSTTTVETTRFVPITTREPVPDLCQRCLVEGGIGYNPFPNDCSKYVICRPSPRGYTTTIVNCPFGTLWSKDAVACMDARYVECLSDKCDSMMEGATYQGGNCRQYYRCSNRRSNPMCCNQGQRYESGRGCVPDSSCRDPCGLDTTQRPTCRFRPDPTNIYKYFEVVPGVGQRQLSCPQGTAYLQKKCSCTPDEEAYLPVGVCTALVNLTFDGNFEDQSLFHRSIVVDKVALAKRGMAQFTGNGFLEVTGLDNLDLKDKFFFKLKYKRFERNPSNIPSWNDNGNAGFQGYYESHGTSPMRYIKGNTSFVKRPPPPPGANANPIDIISMGPGNTIVIDPSVATNIIQNKPEPNLRPVSIVNLGFIGTQLREPTMAGGVIFIPNTKGMILAIEETFDERGQLMQTWQILQLSNDGSYGQVIREGKGEVSPDIQAQYGFDLRPPEVMKWYIVTPTGITLQKGTGAIPETVQNRYAGYTAGFLLKIFYRGKNVDRWIISKPDGSAPEQGQGPIPPTMKLRYKLQDVLKPTTPTVEWYILGPRGDIKERGTGPIPQRLMSSYRNMPSVSILTLSLDDSEQSWILSRGDGKKLLEGVGSIPQGIKDFVQGPLKLQPISYDFTWEVVLPDGTKKTGRGQIPPNIANMFISSSSSNAGRPNPQTMGGQNFPSGSWPYPTNQGAGYPQNMDSPANRNRGGSITSQWSINMPDGSQQSGEGKMPGDLKGMIDSGLATASWTQRYANGTVQRGEGTPPDMTRYEIPQSRLQEGTPPDMTRYEIPQSRLQYKFYLKMDNAEPYWKVVYPDKREESGQGALPLETRNLLYSLKPELIWWKVTFRNKTDEYGVGVMPTGIIRLFEDPYQKSNLGLYKVAMSSQLINGAVQGTWRLIRPDQSEVSGVGELPANLQALLRNEGNMITKQWTVTFPNGTQATGTGPIPPQYEAYLRNRQPMTNQKWKVVLPDGTIEEGTGDMPKHLERLLQSQGSNVNRQWQFTGADGKIETGQGGLPQDYSKQLGKTQQKWSVTMPDGTVESGVGDMPQDIKNILMGQGIDLSGSNQGRKKRAAGPGPEMDIFSNGGTQLSYNSNNNNNQPSFHLTSTSKQVILTVATTTRPAGVKLALPTHAGMNEVMFMYDGQFLHGSANGIARKVPLTGNVVPKQSMFVMGKSGSRPNNMFSGVIDMFELFNCIP